MSVFSDDEPIYDHVASDDDYYNIPEKNGEDQVSRKPPISFPASARRLSFHAFIFPEFISIFLPAAISRKRKIFSKIGAVICFIFILDTSQKALSVHYLPLRQRRTDYHLRW